MNLAEIEIPDTGLVEVTIMDLYEHLVDCSTKIKPYKVKENTAKFAKGINTTKLFAIYICKQEQCQKIVQDADVLILMTITIKLRS